MRVLVTGVSGFIGSVLANDLVQSGHHKVIGLVRDVASNSVDIDVIQADLKNLDVAKLPPVDYVIHAAQSRLYRDFPAQGKDIFDVNVASTQRLLDYAVGCGATGFCLLSSGSVYEPYLGGLDMDARLSPTSANGLTKLAAETIALAYRDSLKLCIGRIFFPYGPNQVARMIPSLIDRVALGNPITLHGQNGYRFTPLFVNDLSAMICKLVQHRYCGNTNLAGREVVSVRDVAEYISQALAIDPVYCISDYEMPDIIAPLDNTLWTSNWSFTSVSEGICKTVEQHTISRWPSSEK